MSTAPVRHNAYAVLKVREFFVRLHGINALDTAGHAVVDHGGQHGGEGVFSAVFLLDIFVSIQRKFTALGHKAGDFLAVDPVEGFDPWDLPCSGIAAAPADELCQRGAVVGFCGFLRRFHRVAHAPDGDVIGAVHSGSSGTPRNIGVPGGVHKCFCLDHTASGLVFHHDRRGSAGFVPYGPAQEGIVPEDHARLIQQFIHTQHKGHRVEGAAVTGAAFRILPVRHIAGTVLDTGEEQFLGDAESDLIVAAVTEGQIVENGTDGGKPAVEDRFFHECGLQAPSCGSQSGGDTSHTGAGDHNVIFRHKIVLAS